MLPLMFLFLQNIRYQFVKWKSSENAESHSVRFYGKYFQRGCNTQYPKRKAFFPQAPFGMLRVPQSSHPLVGIFYLRLTWVSILPEGEEFL
jgi:hypothetical protein